MMTDRKRLSAIVLHCLCGLAAVGVTAPWGGAAAQDPPPPTPAARVLPAAPTLPATLSLADAIKIFRAHGLDLLIAEAAVQNAEGDLKVAGAVPNPQIDGAFLKTFNYDPDVVCGSTGPNGMIIPGSGVRNGCSDKGFSLGISDQTALEDSLSGKRHLRLKVARAALQAARMTRADAQRNLEFQVKQQYVQVGLAALSLDFAKEVQVTSQKTADLNGIRYKSGAISEADLAKAETAALEADQQVDLAVQALRTAKVGLVFLLGVRDKVPEFNVETDTLHYRLPQVLGGATPQSLLSVALDHRPDLRAAAYQLQRAEASIDLAKRLIVPDTSINFQYTQEGTGGGAYSGNTVAPNISIGLSMTLPLFYQQQGEIKKARADRNQQNAQYAKQIAQVLSDVETSFVSFDSSKKLVNRMEGRLLNRAKRTRDLVEFQYKKGAASLLEYLDAQRTYIATNVEYLQDLTNYWTAVYQLEQAVGTELR